VSVVAPNDALSGNPFYPVTLIDDQDARGTVAWAERRNQACSRVPYSLSVQIFHLCNDSVKGFVVLACPRELNRRSNVCGARFNPT
jgi:hypothetical protein